MSSTSILDNFGNIANIIGTLHPAVGLLAQIYQEYAKVQHNRGKCLAVCERAKHIILTINANIQHHDNENTGVVQHGFDRLYSDLQFIFNMMRDLSEMDFFRSLLRYQSISKSIEQANTRLSDILTCFNIASNIRELNQQESYEQARLADADALRKRISSLEFNDSEILRALDIKHNQILDAMCAMQKQIGPDQSDSIERKALQCSLNALQRLSSRTAPRSTPQWIITLYDIDIDEHHELGKGTFGVVKKGTWNGAPVAVKQMTDDTSEKLLLEEIKIWSKLNHPHVLHFYGASVTAHPPFFVSQFMGNGNLIRFLRTNPDANRVQLIHEVARGLAYLHTEHVIHGDLKGCNILIDDGEKACLADFGLSRVKSDTMSRVRTAATPSGVGTLRFLAPEAMTGAVTYSTDIYSFGMLIYETFMEEAPFSTVPDGSIFYLIGERHKRLERPTSLEATRRGLSDDMWKLLWDCTSPNPKDRPSAAEARSRTKQLAEVFLPTTHQSPKTRSIFDDPVFGSPPTGTGQLPSSTDAPSDSVGLVEAPDGVDSVRSLPKPENPNGSLRPITSPVIKIDVEKVLPDHNAKQLVEQPTPGGSAPPTKQPTPLPFTGPGKGFFNKWHSPKSKAFPPQSPTISPSPSSSPDAQDVKVIAPSGFIQNDPNIFRREVRLMDAKRSGQIPDRWERAGTVTIPSYESIQNVCVSPEGRFLAVTGVPPTWPSPDSQAPYGHPLNVLDMLDGRRIWGCDKTPSSAPSFSTDGLQLVFGTDSGAEVWRSELGIVHSIESHHRRAKAISYFASDQHIISVTSSKLLTKTPLFPELYRGSETLPLNIFESEISRAIFSPNGNDLAMVSANNTLKCRNQATKDVSLHFPQPSGTEYTCVVFSPDGTHVAASIRRDEAHKIFIWEVKSGRMISAIKPERTVVSLAFAQTYFGLASCSSTGHLTFWDLRKSEMVCEIVRGEEEPPRRGLHIIFTPTSHFSDSKLLSISPQGTLTTYDPVFKTEANLT